MTFVRTCGEFLSRLNHAGKLGKVIKTMPEFEPGTDPEIVKLNFAIATARKIGSCIISRLNKESNYVVGLVEQTMLSTFLNNEYVGVISKSNEIVEYKNLGAREYTYGNDIDILACFVDNVENYDEEKKSFNAAVKTAHKYQVVIKEGNKYKSEYKGLDDVLLGKILNSDYLGVFTKSGTYAEFKKVDTRKISAKTLPPAMFNDGYVVDTSIKAIVSPAIPVIPPTKSVGDKVLAQFNHCVGKTSEFNFIKFKNGEFLDIFGYIHNLTLVDSLIDGNYIGFRAGKNTLIEYYSLGTTDLFNNMNQNERLIEFGFTDDTEGFTKAFSSAIEKNSWFIYRWKTTPFTSNYYENGTKPQTLLKGVDYFAHISRDGKITEFVKIGEREIVKDVEMSLPILPTKSNVLTTEKSNIQIDNLTKSYQQLVNTNSYRLIRFKDNEFLAEHDVMWETRVIGSSYFAFKYGKTLSEYSLLEVRDITKEMLPNPRLQNYDIIYEYLLAFRNELFDTRTKFLVRAKKTSYVGQNHMSVMDYGKADYIGLISKDRTKLYEYVKTGVRNITSNIELPNVI